MLFPRKIDHIRMHGQVKANLIHSVQLPCCLSRFLQRMYQHHLPARKTTVDRYISIVKNYVITLDVGVVFARKMMDVVHLKWLKIWHETIYFHIVTIWDTRRPTAAVANIPAKI